MVNNNQNNGDGSNNIQIGEIGNKNKLIFNNTQENYAQLEIEEETKIVLTKKELLHRSINGLLKIFLGLLLGIFGLISDSIGISQYFGVSLWWLLIPGLLFALLLAKNELRDFYILLNIPKNNQQSRYIGKNQIIQSNSESTTVLMYCRTAPCIYPRCNGKIILVDAPEREKERISKTFVGICNVCGKDHSYVIDYNWIASPAQLDWRPISKSQ